MKRLKRFSKSITAITAAALFVTILPLQQIKAEVQNSLKDEELITNSNSSKNLPAPQGRAVNTNYPQMEKPTVEAIKNNDDTGYINVSWKPVENVTKYQIILFNGSMHSYWDVPADQTSWTTKGKGMFPTKEQLEAGQVNFHRNGTGTEFSTDPCDIYQRATEVDNGLNYTDSTVYYVRVTAVHEDGARPISYAETASFLEVVTPEEEALFDTFPTLDEMSEEQKELFYNLLDEEIENSDSEDPELLRGEIIDAFESETGIVGYLWGFEKNRVKVSTAGHVFNIAISVITGNVTTSVTSFIKKKGKKEADRLFSKTIKSKLTAWGAPKLANSITAIVAVATEVFDVGLAIAKGIDRIDSKPNNGWIDYR
ncbi:hypothetical protein ACFVRR_00300 [Gottfriedia sp. NPDC057948]|uniref:hypothetical protein n=1 Tax=Gottfriedia sp. NPDC057948 TaxID=3346287 RepID=UPI0036DC3711